MLVSKIIYFQYENKDSGPQCQAGAPGVELQKDCMCVSKLNYIFSTRARGSMFSRPSRASRSRTPKIWYNRYNFQYDDRNLPHADLIRVFLAHQIWTFPVFTHVRLFYLTHLFWPLGKIKNKQPHVGRTL